MSGSALTTGRLSVIVDGSDQGHCPERALVHLSHSTPQRFKNAYLDATMESSESNVEPDGGRHSVMQRSR